MATNRFVARTIRAFRLCSVYWLVALAVLAGPLAVNADAAKSSARPVKVMTRNLFIGADASLLRSIAATSVEELLAANAQVWANVQATDFPSRAIALAREIAAADPTLIGLQEVGLWYSGPIGDPSQATTLEYDFLATLLQRLATGGTPYDVVQVQHEADLEGPAGAPVYRDLRFVLRDVILVKAGQGDAVRLTNPRSANFANNLTVTNGVGVTFTVMRGWASVDAVVNRRQFRFVTTHLDAFHPGISYLQAQELIAPEGPVGSASGPVILVGDLNSGPEQEYPTNLAFSVLAASGLADTWAAAHPGDPGLTWGFDETLDNRSAAGFDRRIDHVMTKGSTGVVSAWITGLDPDNRTAAGLWPSDHAGVVTSLTP